MPRAAARIAAALGFAAGAAALAGWAFGLPVPNGPVGDVVDAKPSTALGFLLVGASLWLLAPGRAGARRRAGQTLGALASLIGAASLAEYAIGADLGVGPGVPQTAVGLLLLGVALVTVDSETPRRQALTEVLLLSTAAIGFFSLVAYAYAYGSGSSATVQALAPVPTPTALMLLILCGGVLCAGRGHRALEIMRGGGAGDLMARRLLPIAVLAMPALGWLRLQGERADLYDQGTGVALFVAVVVAMLAVGIVITERALDRAEAENRQHQQQLQAILDSTTSAIYVKDLEGRFLLVNRRCEEVIGRPKEQILGSTVHDLYPPDAADAFQRNDHRALETDGPLESEEVAPQEGGPRTFVSVKVPLTDARGEPYAICGVSTDITDRKRAEEAAGEARQRAERADRAKSEFLSRMSHELRTPLNSIIGFGQLLEMDGLDETQREYVERILKGGRHLLDLINEVLDISRIEAGTLGISLEPVDAHTAITEALALIRPMAADRGLRLYLPSAPPELSYVTADQQRLKQILLNLLSNGVKYNRDGGAITVSLEQRGERVRLMVADTGAGLSAEQMQRLFVPFERLGLLGHEIEGTGLGLALSKRLAEAMGGALEVESERGVGTTFVLELPRAQQPRPGVELAPADRPATDAEDDSRAKVLYIEDNLSNLRLVEEILSHRPELKLIAAMQGSLGLELAERHRPDLIILDLHLPDMPGGDVLARLHSEPALRAIPVVVLSADATEGQIERLLEAGARAYLTKPLDVRRFLEVIDEHISPSRTRGRNETEREASWMPQR